MRHNRSIVSVILAICILLSCTVTGVSAALITEPQPPFYFRYPFNIMMAGLPKTIKAQFDYDRDFIEIASDYPDTENHPSYNGVGFTFPLATEEYGSLYDVSYTVNDTIISFTYTLKSGVTLNDLLDALEAPGIVPVSREDGARNALPIFDIAMVVDSREKVDAVTFAKVLDLSVLEVVTTDGKSLDVTSNKQNSEVYCYSMARYLPDPDAPPEEPYLFLDKLIGQYRSKGVDETTLATYDECFTHTDENGEIDWALVKAQKEYKPRSSGVNPAYYEFGNRVLDIEDRYEPFAFGMGVYSVKHGCFFDVFSPKLYELPDIERVWTEIGAGKLMGDMDGDNELTIADATLIQRCQAEIISYPEDDVNIPSDMIETYITFYSDFDQDGERDITDATAIQRYLAFMQYHPADWIPYPHIPQPDPTEPVAPIIRPTQPKPTEAPTEAPTQAPTEAPTQAPTEPETEAPTEAYDPSIPRITGLKSTGFGVEMKLSTVPGAEKYRVYHKNENGGWTKIGETTGNTFIHDDVMNGTSYTYTVRCVKADNSAFTSDFERAGWTYTYDPHLDMVHTNGCEILPNGLKIKWGAVDGADLYRLYRLDDNGKWTRLGDTRETSMIDTSIIPGYNSSYSHLYTVRCLSCKGRGFASDFNWGHTYEVGCTPRITGFTVRGECMKLSIKSPTGGNIRVYRKGGGSNSWKRIGELPYVKETWEMKNGWEERYVFYDYDVQPGETYTYTVRNVSPKDGGFISWYNTDGWSSAYRVEDYDPKLQYAIYAGEGTLLVQAEPNKFGITNYRLDIQDNFRGEGYAMIGSDPIYLTNYLFFTKGTSINTYLTGLDESGNRVTSRHYTYTQIEMKVPPENVYAKKIGDRQYRFWWSGGTYGLYEEMLLISEDGQYLIDSGITGSGQYEVDLSAYPADTKWYCSVISCSKDGISYSLPNTIEFNESDYQ